MALETWAQTPVPSLFFSAALTACESVLTITFLIVTPEYEIQGNVNFKLLTKFVMHITTPLFRELRFLHWLGNSEAKMRKLMECRGEQRSFGNHSYERATFVSGIRDNIGNLSQKSG